MTDDDPSRPFDPEAPPSELHDEDELSRRFRSAASPAGVPDAIRLLARRLAAAGRLPEELVDDPDVLAQLAALVERESEEKLTRGQEELGGLGGRAEPSQLLRKSEEATSSLAESMEEGYESEDYQSTEEQYRRVLGNLWQIAEGAVTGGGSLGVDSDDNDFFDLVMERYTPQEFFVSDWAEGSMAGAEGLTGTTSEIAIKVFLRVQEIGEDRRALAAFYQGPVATTLIRLARDDVGTPENHVDILLMPLGRLGIRPRECSGSIQDFVAGLRSYLLTQPPEERGPGFYTTFGAAADLSLATRGRACLLQGAFYYHETLSFYWRQWRQRGHISSPEELKRVRIAAHNIANALDGIRKFRGTREFEPEILRVRSLLKQISAAALPVADEYVAEELAAAADLITEVLDLPPTVVSASWPALLDDMMASPTSWLGDDQDHRRLALLEVAGGLARLVLNGRLEDAASTFFNAAVSVDRLYSSSEASDRAPYDRSRALLNGAGLWWAVQSDDDPRAALDPNDGLDCAVNFFSACSNLEWSTEDREQLAAVGRVLFSYRRVLPHLASQYFQITNSLGGILGSEPETPGSPVPLEELRSPLRAILAEVVQRSDAEAGSSWDLGRDVGSDREATLVLGRVALAQVFPSDEIFEDCVRSLTELMRSVEMSNEEPVRTLVELYGPMASPEEEGDPGRGPLVEAGLMEREDWLRAARDLRPPPAPSAGHLLRRNNALNWLLSA